jgi:hypothetical protein
MKLVSLSMLLVCTLFVFSCSDDIERTYYKSFFIHETSFNIEGEVFVNDNLTEKAEFSRIFVRTNSVENWEIEGIKKEGNKFEIPINVTANGITLSSETIIPGVGLFYSTFNYPHHFPNRFSRCVLNFYVDVRSAKGAKEPEFGTFYYYVYIPEAIDLSGVETDRTSGPFGAYIQEYYYDLNFSQPGWYKVYCSEDKPIGNKAAYSSGANTKIRSPK